MSELSQTGERGRELTAEEWKKVDELVDEMGWSYYKARLALGLEPPSGQNVSADEKPRPRRRCYFAAFDTRTGDAMSAYASKQEPSDKERGRN